jgi:hypothetical protein
MLSIRDVPCGGLIEDEAAGRQASRLGLQRLGFSKQIYAAIAPSQTLAESTCKPLQFVTLALFLRIMRLWIASTGRARVAAGINRGCRIENRLSGIPFSPTRLAGGSDNRRPSWSSDGHPYTAYDGGWDSRASFETRPSLATGLVDGVPPILCCTVC